MVSNELRIILWELSTEHNAEIGLPCTPVNVCTDSVHLRRRGRTCGGYPAPVGNVHGNAAAARPRV